uniref:Uncharacterized protein n=1 Tax=Oryza brachyantha TaxID=4533 RepID=J3L2W0_ORYBR
MTDVLISSKRPWCHRHTCARLFDAASGSSPLGELARARGAVTFHRRDDIFRCFPGIQPVDGPLVATCPWRHPRSASWVLLRAGPRQIKTCGAGEHGRRFQHQLSTGLAVVLYSLVSSSSLQSTGHGPPPLFFL